MVPSSDLERALMSTRFNGEGIQTDSSSIETQRIEEFQGVLAGINPERIIDLQIRLDEDLPYFQISSDESIRDYFSRFGVPITNKRDLELFSSALSERVSSLDKENEKVRTNLEGLAYRKQLHDLPRVLKSLDQTLSNFNALEAPFEVVMRYVFEQTSRGFKMKENGNKALEPYPGVLSVTPDQGCFQVEYTLGDEDVLAFGVAKEKRIELVDKVKKRRFLPDKNVKRNAFIETGESLGFPLKIFGREWRGNKEVWIPNLGCYRGALEAYTHHNFFNEYVVKIKTGKLIGSFVSAMLADPDRYAKSFQVYLKTLFNLPSIMHNYTLRTEMTLKESLDSTIKEINGSSK